MQRDALQLFSGKFSPLIQWKEVTGWSPTAVKTESTVTSPARALCGGVVASVWAGYCLTHRG